MAKVKSVWGIDIGHTALKALRCHLAADGSVVADSYEFIEYPKILTSPDADPDQLVRDAMQTFLSRNSVRGDLVAMVVSGQAGLSRFFKPPPVDIKTLPDIVRYEVRQQIPFAIEDVVWDWQALGGSEVDNVVVDCEVGLFAIKRDTVFGALQPFLSFDVEVDLVQLAPLAVHNAVRFDLLDHVPDANQVDMDNPPPSVVVLAMGTDATDLIVTNGLKLWLRNVPIGGNHFTKQLSRELKLTHAKAEHLKRHARQAEDPKSVFQAMRPVFSDLVTEIQRSLTFYQGIEKNARVERIVLLGNAAKLPGLRQFLNNQLEIDIAKVSQFRLLRGDTVVNEKSFTDNVLAFAPCYGLCLQGLGKAQINTNLLPQEFVTERLIRAKKPWVLASVGALLLGMLLSYFFTSHAWWRSHPKFSSGGTSWEKAAQAVDQTSKISQQYKNTDEEQNTQLRRVNSVSAELASATDLKTSWLDLMSALYQLLPRDERIQGDVADAEAVPFEDRKIIYINGVESQYVPDLAAWYRSVAPRFYQQMGGDPDLTVAQAATSSVPPPPAGFAGPGWVIEISAHHFHNSRQAQRDSKHGLAFVREQLLRPMLTSTFEIPIGPDRTPEEFMLTDIGVYFPTIVEESNLTQQVIPNPFAGQPRPVDPLDPTAPSDAAEPPADEAGDGTTPPAAAAPPTEGGGPQEGQETNPTPPADEPPPAAQDTQAAPAEPPKEFHATRYDFKIQMVFIPLSRDDYLLARQARLAAEEAAVKTAGEPTADEVVDEP
jgi:type IV pilus assembly protein PilM